MKPEVPATIDLAAAPAVVEPKVEPKVEGEADPSVLGAEPKADDAAKGAPEKYSDFKLPEGVSLDAEALKGAQAVFKDLGLSQESAQKLVDFHSAQLKAVVEAPAEAWKATQTEWTTQLKADPEIGGKLGEVTATVSKALNGLPPQVVKDFKAAMNLTGAGNNPAVVRAVYHLAKMVTEGGHIAGGVPGAQSPGSRPSAAKALFPSNP